MKRQKHPREQQEHLFRIAAATFILSVIVLIGIPAVTLVILARIEQTNDAAPAVTIDLRAVITNIDEGHYLLAFFETAPDASAAVLNVSYALGTEGYEAALQAPGNIFSVSDAKDVLIAETVADIKIYYDASAWDIITRKTNAIGKRVRYFNDRETFLKSK